MREMSGTLEHIGTKDLLKDHIPIVTLRRVEHLGTAQRKKLQELGIAVRNSETRAPGVTMQPALSKPKALFEYLPQSATQSHHVTFFSNLVSSKLM